MQSLTSTSKRILDFVHAYQLTLEQLTDVELRLCENQSGWEDVHLVPCKVLSPRTCINVYLHVACLDTTNVHSLMKLGHSFASSTVDSDVESQM